MEGRPRDERELVLRAQRGDARAYEELVRPHEEIAFRVAYVITRNAADAEDAVQDALVKAWRALGRFRAGEPLRPWLLQIAANEARNRRRSAGRRDRLALRGAHRSRGRRPPPPRTPRSTRAQREQLLAALERAAGGRARRARVPLPARPLRGGDRRGARLARGTVKSRTVARARPAEGGVWISNVSSALCRSSGPRRRSSRSCSRDGAAVAARRGDRARARSRAAFAVPQSRGAILRFFDIGADKIQFVGTLPPAETRPLDAGLGAPVSLAQARAHRAAAPAAPGRPAADLHQSGGAVSLVFRFRGRPVLLSEIRDGGIFLKKLVGGQTDAVFIRSGASSPVSGSPATRMSSSSPASRPGLAGNTLVWQGIGTTYRLEGPRLTKQAALDLAASLGEIPPRRG